jgi:bacterioferritin-associated ferredoxin
MFRLITLVAVFIGIALACTSDCTSCHPNLDVVNDARHQPLRGCITCHPNESLKDTPMVTGCGTDCFACHSTDKLIAMPQHEVIQECIGCHQSMDKNPFAKKQTKMTEKNELKNLFLKDKK